MIDYDTFCRIKHLSEHDQLTVPQIACTLALDQRTVDYWLAQPRYRPRQSTPQPSKLDPFKPTIRHLLEKHPYSAQQIFQHITAEGFDGAITIVKDYVRTVRPPRKPAFLTLEFAPGECAQVDWGHWHPVAVGHAMRKLAFFVMVLAYSRLMYVEFTVSQTMEFFLNAHLNAFEYFGRLVPAKIMVDNLKSAVLQRLTGQAPVFNPRYRDFSQHLGFEIIPCGVRQAQEKGRVESGVGYTKKNLLAGLDIPHFSVMKPTALHWLDTIANTRIHGETKEKPRERFEREKPHLRPLSPHLYDIGSRHNVVSSNRFRVTFQTNRYSVPAEYASTRLSLKAYPDRICVYHRDKFDEQHLIARHPRCFDKHRDLENPDHPKALLEERRSARYHKLLQRFFALSSKAEPYYQALQLRRLNPRHHITKIVALSEIYGTEALARAIEDALEFQAVSAEYITNLLESRARTLPEPGALHLTRRSDLLELDLPEPDLDVYDTDNPHI